MYGGLDKIISFNWPYRLKASLFLHTLAISSASALDKATRDCLWDCHATRLDPEKQLLGDYSLLWCPTGTVNSPFQFLDRFTQQSKMARSISNTWQHVEYTLEHGLHLSLQVWLS